jgi:hypothetical protein
MTTTVAPKTLESMHREVMSMRPVTPTQKFYWAAFDHYWKLYEYADELEWAFEGDENFRAEFIEFACRHSYGQLKSAVINLR